MSIRDERLANDYKAVMALCASSDLIEAQAFGNPPEKYLVRYKCRGLRLNLATGQPEVTTDHRMEMYLPADYPRRPPRFTWLTPAFNPHISGTALCIDDSAWRPNERLDYLLVRIGRIVAYQETVNTGNHMNSHASEWATKNPHRLPVDDRPFVGKAKIGADEFRSKGGGSEWGPKEIRFR